MKLLAVISHKGGAGKTTTAVMLAEELAERGYRVLLVDADRQHSAGLLLDLTSSEERVQETRVGNLDYFASGRLTELDVEDRYAELQGTYDVGVVDTPSLDDALARAWLRESDAALVVLQVEPLTMKTMHGAMATIETVRRVNPRIQVLGLLPTLFEEAQATHRTLLNELVSRRRDSVFPAIPRDAGLMHRAGMSWAANVGAAARDAYWAVADRVVSTMDLTVGPVARQAEAPVTAPAPIRHGSRAGYPAELGGGHESHRSVPDSRLATRDSRLMAEPPVERPPQVELTITRTAAPRPNWGRQLAPFALGFAAALLVLALAMGPLRARLFSAPAPAYAVPPPPSPGTTTTLQAAPQPVKAPAPAPSAVKKPAAAVKKPAAGVPARLEGGGLSPGVPTRGEAGGFPASGWGERGAAKGKGGSS
jgi:chromosome partitioning protein